MDTGPKPVAEQSGTILWFEYLLDSSLLEKQLSRENSDSQATELIVEFLVNSHSLNVSEKNNSKVIDVEGTEAPNGSEPKTRKSLALKILALKCAAHLKWNFQLLENRVPLTLQQLLYQDLLFFSENGKVDIKSHISLDFREASPHTIFAVSTYHRWVLWALKSIQIITKPNKVLHIPMPGGQGPTFVPPHITEAMLNSLKLQAIDSVLILENILKELNGKKMIMPTISTFVSLTENSTSVSEHRWQEGYSISIEEFELQLRYDLAVWFMFANQYSVAKRHLQVVGRLFADCQSRKMEYCTISAPYLKGFLSACQIQGVNDEKSLTEKMHESIKNHYVGFLSVLQEDNIRREVPIHYREMAELDLLSAAASGKFTIAKDLVFKVQTLNVVRRALADYHIPGTYFKLLADEEGSGFQFLISELERVHQLGNKHDENKIKGLLSKILMTGGDKIKNSLFSNNLLKEIMQGEWAKIEPALEHLPFNPDFPHSLLPQIECGELIQQLIESYRTSEIQTLLDRLSHGWPNRPLWTLYKKWEIPIPFQSAVMNLPKGMLQDWSYILLAKYRELLSLQDFAGAVEMLKAVEERGRTKQLANSQAGSKLFKLIEWEILLVDVLQFLHKWPVSSNSSRFAELTTQCRGCLGALQRGETIFPRSEVVDYCVALLLAACEWEFLLGLDVRWNLNLNVELASSLAAVCYDLQRDRERPTRKNAKSLWDLIIPAFNPTSANSGTMASQGGGSALKRTAAGALQQGGSSARDSPNANVPLVNRAALSKFCQLLYEPQSLNITLSLFVRLHNVVQDEANLEINADLSSLWPAVLSNANSYHLPGIGELLSQLLERALSLYPLNTDWLKLQGDLHFAQGFHSAAMSCFMTAASLASDYFHQVVPKQVLDEATVRRMIKCSHSASCFTQSALLCQLLEEIDYATAFRCLQERGCNDAMDSLYPFIWDVTLLEFIIQLHHKRGETQRKTAALKAIGMLELNANNNEEILREAAAQRKAQFLRCLAKQYL